MTSQEAPTAGPRVRVAEEVEIATYHLGGDGPPLLLAHATGLHGRCWMPMAEILSDRFSVWALDHRGHGASGKDPRGRYDDWSVFVGDLLAVLDELGGTGWRAIGHSMGGAVLLLAEARQPGTFASLCCYEPVAVPPGLFDSGSGDGPPLSDLARRRRSLFPSKAAARENFASKPPFSRFHPAALDAYVEYGFVEVGGGVTLACAREDEASVYEGATKTGAWECLGSVRVPVTVVGGHDPADPVGRLVEDIARRIPRGAARRVEGLGHFGPFEDPERVAELAAEALGAGRGRSTTAVSTPG
jgi:pimeloyl-ACP methyl ester carboxylesterase